MRILGLGEGGSEAAGDRAMRVRAHASPPRRAVARLGTTPSNPAPGGAELHLLSTDDGFVVRAALWRCGRSSRATVVLLQGRGDQIEKYFEIVDDLRARGFSVATLDWRGQGGSQRLLPDPRKSHVDDFASYGRDLAALMGLVRRTLPGPVLGLAHSMGAAILLDHLRLRPGAVDAAVLTAPMLALSPALKPPLAELLCAALARAGLRGRFIPGRSRRANVTAAYDPGNVLTSDPVRLVRWVEAVSAEPEFGLGNPTIGWLDAAFRVMARINAAGVPEGLRTPLLVAAGTGDRVTCTPSAALFTARVPGARFEAIAQARHEVLLERDPLRERFFAAFDAFVDEVLPERRHVRAAGSAG